MAIPRILLTRRWMLRHAIAAFLLLAFAGFTWWQIIRAGEGNLRSYAYAVEWPVFMAFVVYVWWKTVKDELHENPDLVDLSKRAAVARPEIDDSDDPELAAYNRYLATLNSAEESTRS